jgi:enoyl-CoA hydratase
VKIGRLAGASDGQGSVEDIRFEQRRAVAFVTLNRPGALNALTLEMVRAYDPVLRAWEGDPAVKAVVIRGAGERAFCAGGDIRAVCRARDAGDAEITRSFFREEYLLNRRIARFPKPYVALLDGIAMGGGLGLSIHGSHRVVTQRTVLAMPETGIGLFPDIGGTYFLPRLPGRLGLYLALTGARLGPADALAAGFGTHFVGSGRLAELEAALEGEDWSGDPFAAADAVIRRFAEPAGHGPLAARRAEIDRCFSADSLDGVFANLEVEGTDWTAVTLRTLSDKSPTSLAVTFEALRRGAEMTLEEALTMEYRLSQRFVASHDFCEGVRALLEDGGRPLWEPARLDEVTEEMVSAHFEPLPGGELSFDPAPR